MIVQVRGRDVEARGAQLGDHPARRTRASRRARSGAVELVALAEVERVDVEALAPASAVTVTPRSIANGIASPSL